jgi:hypothetical protein
VFWAGTSKSTATGPLASIRLVIPARGVLGTALALLLVKYRPLHRSMTLPYAHKLLAFEGKAYPKADEQRPTYPVQPAPDFDL